MIAIQFQKIPSNLKESKIKRQPEDCLWYVRRTRRHYTGQRITETSEPRSLQPALVGTYVPLFLGHLRPY